MSLLKSKLRLICAFAALATLALAASCRGFFVKPTLSSIVVTPGSPSIETGNTNNTVQMSVVATFNDGSSGSTPVSWKIDDTSIATINASGLVTSVSTGTANVTATANVNPSITGSQPVTVTVACIQSIAISPTSFTISVTGTPNTEQFAAKATTCNGVIDITTSASWNSSNTAAATVAGGLATAVAQGSTIISASSGGVNSTTNATLTVNP